MMMQKMMWMFGYFDEIVLFAGGLCFLLYRGKGQSSVEKLTKYLINFSGGFFLAVLAGRWAAYYCLEHYWRDLLMAKKLYSFYYYAIRHGSSGLVIGVALMVIAVYHFGNRVKKNAESC